MAYCFSPLITKYKAAQIICSSGNPYTKRTVDNKENKGQREQRTKRTKDKENKGQREQRKKS